MRQSALLSNHTALNAQFSDQHGWQLPACYASLEAEYQAAGSACAVQDRSGFGILKLQGKDHVDLLHRLTTNEVRNLAPGSGQLNIFADAKGRIVDRVFLLKSEDSILLLTGAGNGDKIAGWLEKFIFLEDVQVENQTQSHAVLSFFGPEATKVLSAVLGSDFCAPADNGFVVNAWHGTELILQKTPELPVSGFNVICENAKLVTLWDAALRHGAQPLGYDAYNTLRIEAGWPELNRDFDADINPHEAGMLALIDFDKGCYIGQEVIARLDTYDKVQKHLTGLILAGSELPDTKEKIFSEETEIGFVTSSVRSLLLAKGIALGYVRTKFLQEGAAVTIGSDGRIQATITSLPFEAES